MKKVFLIFLITITTNFLFAQSIIGRWKTVSNVLVNNDGKQDDVMIAQLKAMPCIADLQSVFDVSGKQYTKSPTKCGIDYNKLPPSTWKVTGNVLSITNNALPNPLGKTLTYTLAFMGDKAILTHIYTNTEKVKLHSPNLKKVIITYVRSNLILVGN